MNYTTSFDGVDFGSSPVGRRTRHRVDAPIHQSVHGERYFAAVNHLVAWAENRGSARSWWMIRALQRAARPPQIGFAGGAVPS